MLSVCIILYIFLPVLFRWYWLKPAISFFLAYSIVPSSMKVLLSSSSIWLISCLDHAFQSEIINLPVANLNILSCTSANNKRGVPFQLFPEKLIFCTLLTHLLSQNKCLFIKQFIENPSLLMGLLSSFLGVER